MSDYERRAIEAEARLSELTQRVALLEDLLKKQGPAPAKEEKKEAPKKEEKKEVPKKDAPKKEEKKEAPKKEEKKEAPKKEEKKEAPKKEEKKEAPKKEEKKETKADENSLEHLMKLQAVQADKVRDLKKQGASKDQVTREVEILNDLKKKVEEKQKETSSKKIDFPRNAFNQLMTQRFFISPSFEIYGGVAGLYDLGPPACAIKANILNLWRQHFVLQENMLEIDCTSVTPYAVLKTSGHVAKFSDLMVKDVTTGNCFRADHLLEAHLEHILADKKLEADKRKEIELVIAQADAFDASTMAEIFKKYDVKAPDTGHELTPPEPFNLMFSTSIGPSGNNPGFLRPETAQGIFVNFKRLLEYNSGKLPFAGAQIGQAFRNEIAPRSGLLRVREFTLAEIEHFVNPNDKSHTKFHTVKNLVLNLFPRDAQVTTQKTVQMSLQEAVSKGVIANETLAYFLGRTHLFLLGCGIKSERLRFRQHLADEMAHYACDCWDAEIQNSYGWVECVGHADRSAYDLSSHTSATNVPLQAFVEYPDGPRDMEVKTVVIQKSLIGKAFRQDAATIIDRLNSLDEDEITKLESNLSSAQKTFTFTVNEKKFDLTKEMVSVKREMKKVSGLNIIPGVIEPSFGIGRILYSVLEHAYHTRENDEQRGYLKLPPAIAPVKVSILPLMSKEPLVSFISKISDLLTHHAISNKIDDSGVSIGRRYARMDEIGIPFAITIDFDTVKDNTITLRERDSTRQVRVKIEEVAGVLKDIIEGRVTWTQVESKYPAYESKE